LTALIQILDYGSGNLFSIADALSRVPNVKTLVSSKYREGRTDGLVLPGVGSFSSAQKILGENKHAILMDVQENKMPILGICLGMQLMFEKSEEGPGSGLELFRGKVVKFPHEPNLKVPHMGWNTLTLSNKSPFCRGLSTQEWVYYVHSFYPSPKDKAIVKAWTKYGKQRFPAIIAKENILGTQFHPEKSSKAGFKLVKNFARAVLQYSE
jgi:imidazole glycerol-phosphate synthase subunit HisH